MQDKVQSASYKANVEKWDSDLDSDETDDHGRGGTPWDLNQGIAWPAAAGGHVQSFTDVFTHLTCFEYTVLYRIQCPKVNTVNTYFTARIGSF